MLLAKHPYRNWYFFGRIFSFALVGLLSSEIGILLFRLLQSLHLAAALSLFFGSCILLTGGALVLNVRLPGSSFLSTKMARFSVVIGKLMSRNSSSAVFLFGASTILLPCGQTLIVFSEIALNSEPFEGLLHGFLFALFTSPALIAAMRTSKFFAKQKKNYSMVMGCAVLLIGALTLARGFAELQLINHWVLNPKASPQYHLVVF